MRNELSHIEEIENYLNGKLSQSDRIDFETKMSADVSLREDVELQKTITDRLQFLAFKAEVISSHAGFVSAQKVWWKRGLFLNSILALIGCAAVVLIVVTVADKSAPETKETAVVIPDGPKKGEIPAIEILPPPVTSEEPVETVSHRSKSEKNEPHLAFQKPFEKTNLNATLGGTIITKDSKSSIHFDPNSLVDKQGNLVHGNVEIRYREYRNPAEMAFSGIPMVYSEDNKDYRFNSTGMIEVRAYQNDEELSIKPGADFTIDYNVTQQVDSCFFFALNDENQEWEKKQRIDFDSLNAANLREAELLFYEDSVNSKLLYRGMLQGRVDLVLLGGEFERGLPPITINLYYPKDYYQGGRPCYRTQVKGVVQLDQAVSGDSIGPNKATENTGSDYLIERIDSGRYVAEISCDGCDNMIIDGLVIYGDKVSQLDAHMSMVLRDGDQVRKWRSYKIFGKRKRNIKEQWKPSTYVLTDSIMPVDRWDNSARKRESDSLANLRASTYDAMSSWYNAKAKLVSGLQCENFGVYNCDQIKRVTDPINIRPKFVDGKGIVIFGIYLLSMIDLNINAAFSFSPFEFKCERSGRNVILAFTPQKLYAISADDFQAMNAQSSGDYTLRMDDITESVQTSDDLKNYLGL